MGQGDLNHKEERNQLFNAYYVPRPFIPAESKIPCTPPPLHLKDNTLGPEGLSDLSKILQPLGGKPGLQILVF